MLVVGDGDLEILPHPKATVVFCFLELNVLCSYRRPFMFFYVLGSSKNNCCQSYHYLAQLASDKKFLFKHMYKLLALGGLLTASC